MLLTPLFLEGKTIRHGVLSRDHRGPRAVLNALERVADSYRSQCDITAQELEIARGQLRDHQARLGKPFAHDGYLIELTDLRDRLKAGLSQATPEPGTTPVSELAESIKALKAAHTIDAAPERTARRRIAFEEPVTARIRRRGEAASAIEPTAEPEASPAATPAPEVTLPAPQEPASATIQPFPKAETPAPVRPQPSHRQHVNQGRRTDSRQLSLF